MLDKYLGGKKTYLVAAIAAGLAAAEALGKTPPGYVYTLLAALGLYTTRSAVKKLEKKLPF